VADNEPQGIIMRTRELLETIVEANQMDPEDIASVFFTTTRDVTAEYPAVAARQLGWFNQALLCGHEMEVPGGLEKCIRVLIHWNTSKTPEQIQHIYINGAEVLRPELAINENSEQKGNIQ